MNGVSFALLILAVSGCASLESSLTDVSADSRVQHQIGREFVLKEDLYLYIRKSIQLETSLLGPSKAGPLGLGQPRLPSPVSSANIGY